MCDPTRIEIEILIISALLTFVMWILGKVLDTLKKLVEEERKLLDMVKNLVEEKDHEEKRDL